MSGSRINLQHEWPLLVAVLAAVLGFVFEHSLVHAGAVLLVAALFALVAVIISVSFRIAHYAEELAERFGEPYGTMILTFSAVLVEVVMLAILMADGSNPTLARDTVYAAVMMDINGIIGIAAIIGGIRHGEQKYNLNASNSYIAMLLVTLGIAMFVPDFVPAESWRAYSMFTIVITIVLYVVFLRIQTVEHRYFFRYSATRPEDPVADAEDYTGPSVSLSVGMLVVSVILVGVLAEILSVLLEPSEQMFGMPKAVPAVLIALISASPEILTAVRAAIRDQMQTVINIALGASLATVLLTVPVIELFALINGMPIEMGITPVQAAMLLLTLLAAMINLHDGESNVLEGTVLFALFSTFVMLTLIAV